MIDVTQIREADAKALTRIAAEVERLRQAHPARIVTAFILASAIDREFSK